MTPMWDGRLLCWCGMECTPRLVGTSNLCRTRRYYLGEGDLESTEQNHSNTYGSMLYCCVSSRLTNISRALRAKLLLDNRVKCTEREPSTIDNVMRGSSTLRMCNFFRCLITHLASIEVQLRLLRLRPLHELHERVPLRPDAETRKGGMSEQGKHLQLCI